MNWYYSIRGGHTHVRVFMNGGKCGDLCFRNEEFEEIKQACFFRCSPINAFIDEDKEKHQAEARDINYQLNNTDEDRPY